MKTGKEYRLEVDASGMRMHLADIEQGNPRRVFWCASLADAVAMRNLCLMVAGFSMRHGPRKLAPGLADVRTVDQFGKTLVLTIRRRPDAETLANDAHGLTRAWVKPWAMCDEVTG